jgi:PAS domain S-box-containing protein
MPKTFQPLSGSFSRLAIFGLLYMAAAFGSLSYLVSPGGVAVLWPASGVFLGALLATPRSQWWAICSLLTVINFVAEIWVGGIAMLPAAIFSISLMIQALASTLLIQAFARGPMKFGRPRDVYSLLLWGCAVPVAIASLVPATASALLIGGSWVYAWALWAVANAAGVLVVTPLLLTWLRDPAPMVGEMSARKWLEFAAVLIGLCVLTGLAFSIGNPTGAALPPLSYLPMLLLTAVAIRYKIGALTLASILFALVAIVYDSASSMGREDLETSLLVLQTFLIASVGSALLFNSLFRNLSYHAGVIKQSRDRFQLALRAANDGLWDWDLLQGTVYLSPRWKSMLGYEDHEIANQPDVAFGLIHPDDLVRVREAYAASVPDPDVSYEIEFRMRHKDGHWVDIKSIGFVERDEKGQPIRFAGTHSDISERKLAETALRQTQRMETVGQLTGGIAHDFNNLLAIILGNLELVQRKKGLDSQTQELINRAVTTCERAAVLTRKLLSFSRKKPAGASLINVNDRITGMRHLLERSLTAAIQLEVSLGRDLGLVLADPDDLENMLLNLALNSRDAMPRGGRLFIETAEQFVDDSYVRLNPGSRSGDFVVISISDNGCGMSADVMERAFEPFFTTKDAGKGTGLGLSMAYGFIQRACGFVKVDSKIGFGTTFRVFLPRADDPGESSSASQPEPNPAVGGDETIIVLDDEEMLAETACSYLSSLGYKAIKVTNAEDALKALETNPQIDLLFSDVIMPGAMNGYQVAVQAHAAHPSLKILLTSGFTGRNESTANGDAEFVARLTSSLVPKPYSLNDLALSVRNILDK